MNAIDVFSVGIQLAVSLLAGWLAYRAMRWCGQPLAGDEQARAALDRVRSLHEHARRQSRQLLTHEAVQSDS